nr:aminopeptidase P family protein [Ardenticatenales bacterium]
MNQQLDQLRLRMAELGVDAFLVTDEKNRAYLSGFTGSSGALLVTADTAYLVSDFRYFEQAGRQAPEWTLWKQKTTLSDAVSELLGEIKAERVAFEADAMTVAEWRAYQAKEGAEWVVTEGLVRRLRSVKRSDEIEAIRSAQRITDAAAREVPRLIQPGLTEKQVAWELEKLMRDLGADGPAFEIIVASGPNSALPHHRPTERIIQENEMVLVDFGARLAGYHSDMTRTYFTGEPTEEYARIYQIVLDALHEAEQRITATSSAKAMDLVARDHIGGHGYREAFGHGLGHGVGLDIHEMPSLSFRVSDEELL